MAETDGNKSGHKISGRFLYYGETCICDESKGWSDECVSYQTGRNLEGSYSISGQKSDKEFQYLECGTTDLRYYENEDGMKLSEDEKAAKDSLTEKIQDTFDWISTPGEDMRLMYHNFGVVRENKELIRHRVFMTKLKEGCAEEYKARHDGLIAQRGDTVDPGPDSNFSIWSAGGYIFGYDEIDTTMEIDETPQDREATVAWETRQLGIMDWITNDVDWMTGDVHADVKRLAWHN